MVLDNYLRLLAYGARRGRGFLTDEADKLIPFFGLCDVHVIEALAADLEYGEATIAYFRSIAQYSGLSPADGVIVLVHYAESQVGQLSPLFYEFASIGPYPPKITTHDLSGETVYSRWFHQPPTTTPSDAEAAKVIKAIEQRKTHVFRKGEQAEKVRAVQGTSLNEWGFHPMPKLFSHADSRSLQESMEISRLSLMSRLMTLVGSSSSALLEAGKRGLFLQEGKRAINPYSLRPTEALVKIQRTGHLASLWQYMSNLVNQTESDARKQATESDVPILASKYRVPENTYTALRGLSFANEVFAHINHPTISLACLETPMWQVNWMAGESSTVDLAIVPKKTRSLNRCKTFGCIAFFDSGSINLDPDYFTGVLALCNENSIYVAAILLSDPSKTPPDTEVCHIVGNIGRKGMSLLVAPQTPQIRDLVNDPWLVQHPPYNHKREDNFRGTSLHLSFTSWQPSISLPGQDRTIDNDIFYVESVISVRERGEWVADLDILSIDFENLYKIAPVDKSSSSCTSKAQASFIRDSVDVVSIDCWNELLDAPRATGIFRARGNWAARLAATSVMYQKGQGHSVGIMQEGYMCLKCLSSGMDLGGAGLRSYEANLPSLCID